MEELIKEIESDIKGFEETCKKLKHTDNEYAYWNGCRCQAEVTLKRLKKPV